LRQHFRKILQKNSQCLGLLGFRRYILFEIFGFFVGGSCEVGINWVSDCSCKLSKLLLPPFEGASTVKRVPLISNASASTGAGACSGVGEKMVADTVEEIWTTSCITAVDSSPLGMNINTLCLKEERFPKPDASAIGMLEQLPPTLTATAVAGDDAPDAGDMVDGSACVAMRNPGAEAEDRCSTSDVERRGEHKAITQTRSSKHDAHAHTIHQCTNNNYIYHFQKQQHTYMLFADSIHKMSPLPSL
jgi:hypothetical protein